MALTTADLERNKFIDKSASESIVRTASFDSSGNDTSLNGVVDENNSSHTPLGSGATFTGTAVDILGYSIIYVTVYSDVASATDGLVIEQGHTENGVGSINWDSDDKYTIPAGTGKTFSIQPALQYLRVRYTNGGSAQTDFRLHVVFKRNNGLASSHRIQDAIIDDDDARLVKSVLTAKQDDGTFVNIDATNSGNLRVTDAENGLAIAKGDVTGTTFIHKFGEAPDIDSADGFVDVWDGGGVSASLKTYTFSTTADIDRISSSDNGDTEEIEIQGLDSDFNLVTQTITLTGQTPASLTTSLVRVFRMKNVGTSDLAGNVYCFVNVATTGGVPDTITNTRALIQNGNNQTLMAIYTIPAGKTGYLRGWYAGLANRTAAASIIHLDARPFGQVFQLKHVAAVNSQGTGYIKHDYIEPEVFTEKTDIVMHADSSTNDVAVSAGFDIVLVDN